MDEATIEEGASIAEEKEQVYNALHEVIIRDGDDGGNDYTPTQPVSEEIPSMDLVRSLLGGQMNG